MPRTLSVDGLPALLGSQLLVASRGQLLALGMNDRAMQYRIRPGGPRSAASLRTVRTQMAEDIGSPATAVR